jgi:hypothetical protein
MVVALRGRRGIPPRKLLGSGGLVGATAARARPDRVYVANWQAVRTLIGSMELGILILPHADMMPSWQDSLNKFEALGSGLQFPE